MSALGPVAAAPAQQLRALRVALVVDPASAGANPPDLAGATIHLHFAALDELVPTLPFLRQADVLVVEVMLDRPGQLDHFIRILAEQPRPVIAATRSLDAAATRTLMRAGAADVVALPLAAGDLDEALAAVRKLIASRPQAAAKGRVVSFVRAVGGAGATALACQTGCLWADRQSTCLIDFDVQFGAVALYLDMHPQLGLLDLIEAEGRLDQMLLSTIAARHASGLRIVAAPADIAPLEAMTPAFVAQVLTLAAATFEVVLVDLPAAWTPWSLAALTHSDLVLMISNLSVPGLRQARRQLDLIEANHIAAPLRIVLNRVPKKLFRTIDLADSERVLRRKVDFTIADDAATMNSAVDQGRTIGQVRGKSAVESDLAKLIAGLTEVLAV